MSEIFPETPITSLPDAVAFLGALPVPVGPVPQPLSADRLAEIRSLDLLALMDDRAAPVISGHLAALRAEIGRLEAQRDRRRDCLVALQNDALNVRGALSPNGEDRKVPFPLGPTLLPAVEWLIGRVAELETGLAWRDAERDRWAGVRCLVEKAIDKGWSGVDTCTLEAELGPEVAPVLAESVAEPSCLCPPADQPGPHQVGCFFDGVPVSPPSERPVNGLTAKFMPVAVYREDAYVSPLHQEHRLLHDLPEGCRLTAEQAERLGNPFLGGGA